MRIIYYRPDQLGAKTAGTHALMQDSEHDFILYLLDRYRPKKILEVGVAAGGTSVLLLNNTPKTTQIYGIDIATHWWFGEDPTKTIGFKIYETCPVDAQERYHLFTGKDVVDSIQDIGESGYDFCILDTIHFLPGELLQFFAVYPFLKMGAILVLHDVSDNFCWIDTTMDWAKAWCTKLLFCSLASRSKMLPHTPVPNIGAVVMDDLTKRYIDNTFFALGINWHYFPDIDLLERYRSFIALHYDTFCLNYFKECISRQEKIVKYEKDR